MVSRIWIQEQRWRSWQASPVVRSIHAGRRSEIELQSVARRISRTLMTRSWRRNGAHRRARLPRWDRKRSRGQDAHEASSSQWEWISPRGALVGDEGKAVCGGHLGSHQLPREIPTAATAQHGEERSPVWKSRHVWHGFIATASARADDDAEP